MRVILSDGSYFNKESGVSFKEQQRASVERVLIQLNLNSKYTDGRKLRDLKPVELKQYFEYMVKTTKEEPKLKGNTFVELKAEALRIVRGRKEREPLRRSTNPTIATSISPHITRHTTNL